MKCSLGFIEIGCQRSNLLCPSLSQFTLLYKLVPHNILWCIKYTSGWSVRSARGWSVRCCWGWKIKRIERYYILNTALCKN